MTQSKTKTGPVIVEMEGNTAPEREIGGWPNLVQIADLAIGHFNEICDPKHHYVPYVGGTLGWRKPAFNHHRWDWIEVLPYPILGRIAARRVTGNRQGAEIEIRQRQLLLSSFHNLDGFAYPHYAEGWSDQTNLCIWEQGRVMFALLAWFEESGDERLLEYVRRIVRALMNISHKPGPHRRIRPPYDRNGAFQELSPVSLVECLAKYGQITGDSDAIDLCDGIVHSLLNAKSKFTDDKYRFSGSLRGVAAAIAGITRFAAYVNDDKLLDQAEAMFRSAQHLISRSGATPEEEPCCTLMEMTTAGLTLTRQGRGQWWDMIDRYFRNQVVACQFHDTSAVHVGCVDGEPKPWDDTRDILNRSIGGFLWASPYEVLCWQRRLMLCCSGHALWTLGKICEHAVTEDHQGISINLHFSLDTPLASITHHEPFDGLLEVVPQRGGTVKIRKPLYAKKLTAEIDGVPARPNVRNGYLVFDAVNPHARIKLSYELPEKTTEEVVRLPQQKGGGRGRYCGDKSDPVVAHRIPTKWRGNTVLAIDYANSHSMLSAARSADIGDTGPYPKHRLYADRMDRLDRGAGRSDRVAFFLPATRFEW